MNYLYQHNDIGFNKLESSDLGSLLTLKNESWFGTHRASMLNSSDQRRWFDNLDTDPHTPSQLYLMASTPEDKFGLFKILNIDWQSRRAEAGWDVFSNFRGQGLGKKLVAAGVGFARDVLQLHRLRAEILATNEASMKCAEAADFVREGCERQAILKKGVYVDSFIYGIVFDR